MAVYKVPQNVEADDKLIGPFSFRQFIYLIIVVMAGAMAWGLAQIFIGLVIIPLPIILLFGALALPLRKDQPMEIYLAAIVSFYLKPRKRLWDPDGIESLVQITAPKQVERTLTKNLSQEDADQRFSYLANLVDSQGWAIRSGTGPIGTPMNNEFYMEAQGAQDILDSNNSVAQSFDTLIQQQTTKTREEAVERMHFDPYPNIHQAVVQPRDSAYQYGTRAPAIQAPARPVEAAPQAPNNAYQIPTQDAQPAQPIQAPAIAPAPPSPPKEINQPAKPSEEPPSADIINLANTTGLSVETIAHEAHRRKEEHDMEEEVVISLH